MVAFGLAGSLMSDSQGVTVAADRLGLTPVSNDSSKCYTKADLSIIPWNMYMPKASCSCRGYCECTFAPPQTCLLTWNVPNDTTTQVTCSNNPNQI